MSAVAPRPAVDPVLALVHGIGLEGFVGAPVPHQEVAHNDDGNDDATSATAAACRRQEVLASLRDLGFAADENPAAPVLTLARQIGLHGFARSASEQRVHGEVCAALRERELITGDDPAGEVLAIVRGFGLPGFMAASEPSDRSDVLACLAETGVLAQPSSGSDGQTCASAPTLSGAPLRRAAASAPVIRQGKGTIASPAAARSVPTSRRAANGREYVIISVLGGAGRASLAAFEAQHGPIAAIAGGRPYWLAARRGDTETRVFDVPAGAEISLVKSLGNQLCGSADVKLHVAEIGPQSASRFTFAGAGIAAMGAAALNSKLPPRLTTEAFDRLKMAAQL